MNSTLKAIAAALAMSGLHAAAAHAQGSDLLLPPATYGRDAVRTAAPQDSPPVGTPIPDVDPEDEAFQEALKGIVPLTPAPIEQAAASMPPKRRRACRSPRSSRSRARSPSA